MEITMPVEDYVGMLEKGRESTMYGNQIPDAIVEGILRYVEETGVYIGNPSYVWDNIAVNGEIIDTNDESELRGYDINKSDFDAVAKDEDSVREFLEEQNLDAQDIISNPDGGWYILLNWGLY